MGGVGVGGSLGTPRGGPTDAALGTAEGSLRDAMAPVAAAYGTTVEEFDGGMKRVCDVVGSPVLLGASLPGER